MRTGTSRLLARPALKRHWLTFILIVATTAGAQAQGAPDSAANAEKAREVMEKLHASDPERRAWGAYEAGAFHVKDAIPVLQAILEGPVPERQQWERWALVDLTLDALVQLRARVPAALLARYAGSRPVQAHILLANAPGRAPVLLDLLEAAKGFEWFCAANILLADKVPGLPVHLLKNVRLQLTVSVSEGGNRGSVRGGGMSAGVGDGVGQSPRGFPPHAAYRFESAASAGFVVLTHGPHPVFYSRNVYTSAQYPVADVRISGPSDDDRLRYLQAMVDPYGPAPLTAHTHEVARWTTPAALLEQIAEFRRSVEARFVGLRARIRAAYRLPPDSTRPSVEVHLIDLRENQSVPLPVIPR